MNKRFPDSTSVSAMKFLSRGVLFGGTVEAFLCFSVLLLLCCPQRRPLCYADHSSD